MRRTALAVLVAVAISVTLAGCHVNEPTWTLGVYGVSEQQIDDTTEIHAEVGFGGKPNEETVVTDVRICALNEEGDAIETQRIDRLSTDDWTQNITMHLKQSPATLVLDYETVEADQEFSIKGKNRTDDGRYSTVYQDEPHCGR